MIVGIKYIKRIIMKKQYENLTKKINIKISDENLEFLNSNSLSITKTVNILLDKYRKYLNK